MNVEKIKSILSIICIILGILVMISLSIFSLPYSTAFFGILLLSLSLLIIGIISFNYHYSAYQVILSLLNKDSCVLAHWSFSPLQLDTLKTRLNQDRSTNLSISILLALLGILVAVGALLGDYKDSIYICLAIATLSIICCIISLLLINRYYKYKITQPVEAIISTDFIYFFDELYGFQYSFYHLSNVRITNGEQQFIQFLYGSNGLSIDPAHIVSIPIPKGHLEEALLIKKHYLSHINTEDL